MLLAILQNSSHLLLWLSTSSSTLLVGRISEKSVHIAEMWYLPISFRQPSFSISKLFKQFIVIMV